MKSLLDIFSKLVLILAITLVLFAMFTNEKDTAQKTNQKVEVKKPTKSTIAKSKPIKVVENKPKGSKEPPKEENILMKLYDEMLKKTKSRDETLAGERISIRRAKREPLNERMKATNSKFGDEVFIRIFKSEEELELWARPKAEEQFSLLKIYNICYYSGALGPKLKEGDGQSPEGFYRVYKGSLNPHSSYTLSFNLGFPNKYDKSHGRTGSYLMVHGKCVSVGCYAMGDDNIRQIYKLTHDALYHGQKFVNVHIFPFRMEHLDDHAGNKWYTFWQNLKEGYDLFEESKIPPRVKVRGKEYRFE